MCARLSRERGVAVLWATHLLDEVEPGDAVVVLHRGRVLAAGDVGIVAASPAPPTCAALHRADRRHAGTHRNERRRDTGTAPRVHACGQYLICLRGIIWREALRFVHQRGRFISALVRPLVWLFIFAAGFRQILGVSIIPPYHTYILYRTMSRRG